METTLQQILKVQLAILTELRQLRQALAPQAAPVATPKAAPPIEDIPAPEPAPTAPEPAATEQIAPELVTPPDPAPPLAPSPPSSSTMLTPNELADLGGQFLDPGQMPRSRVKPVDASDLSNSILDDIKARNKAKRTAFSEFEKFGRDR